MTICISNDEMNCRRCGRPFVINQECTVPMRDFAPQPASMNKPAHFKLARSALMMAYTLLAPHEMTVADLNQHIKDMQTGGQETHTPPLALERTLFFEILEALTDGMRSQWYSHGS